MMVLCSVECGVVVCYLMVYDCKLIGRKDEFLQAQLSHNAKEDGA